MIWPLIPLAGLWSMDRSTAFNFMLSRPVVIAAVIGSLYGNLAWCIAGGILLEIIGLMDLPVGTRISSDDSFAAFLYAFLVSQMQIVTIEKAFLIAVLAFLLMFPATKTIAFTRWVNKKLYQRYPGKESMLIWVGQGIAFLRGVIVYAGCTFLVSFFIAESSISIPNISSGWLILTVCVIAGYFSGFFHDPIRTKIILFVAGGLFAWLIL